MQFAKTFLNGNTATAHQLSPPANRLRQFQFWRHTGIRWRLRERSHGWRAPRSWPSENRPARTHLATPWIHHGDPRRIRCLYARRIWNFSSVGQKRSTFSGKSPYKANLSVSGFMLCSRKGRRTPPNPAALSLQMHSLNAGPFNGREDLKDLRFASTACQRALRMFLLVWCARTELSRLHVCCQDGRNSWSNRSATVQE